MAGLRRKPDLVITPRPLPDEPGLVIDPGWALGQLGPMSKQDIVVLEALGRGAFGEVHKVQHVSGAVMARKLIHIAESETRVQIERELSILHGCRCDSIVEFYGAFSEVRSLSICMELMDMSAEELSVLSGPMAEGPISWIDLKPANVLVNCAGQVKLCDMGLSRTLVASEASSFVGTKPYMSPERLLGGVKYNVLSEVWSFGIVLMELAVGRYPIPPVSDSEFVAMRDRQPYSTFDYIQAILNETPPTPSSDYFSQTFCNFIAARLQKTEAERAIPDVLLNDAFLDVALHSPVVCQSDFGGFVQRLYA
ncbi:dual specificity protein kinase FUZ7, partial [Aphelenchoides avenae]